MIFVFAGAGGSAAVDPAQYPTTKVFFDDKLPPEITKAPLFRHVRDFLRQNLLEGKEPDIEDVIEVLDMNQARCEEILSPSELVGWVGKNKRQQSDTSATYMYSLCDSSAPLEVEVGSLNSEIKRLVYDLYKKRPTRDQLSSWIQLLNGLQKIDSPLEIFTTNYDLVLETACGEAQGKVQTGFDGNHLPLNLEYWKSPRNNLLGDNEGLLTKLHGSVNWQYDEGEIVISRSRYAGNHADHCLLYPGYKGTPTEEPFVTFHNHLQNVVDEKYGQLNVAIFIGFAFRDSHINTILKNFPSKTKTCFFTFVDKEAPPDNTPPDRAPQVDSCLHFRNGLREENVRQCLALF